MRKVMRHYTSQPFQSNLHLLFLTKNKQSIITFIDSLCFVLCENITDAGMQAVTFSFLFFLVVFKRQGTDSANTVFLSPSILQMFCVCLCYNIFLVVLYIVDQFDSATTKKMESAAYSRLALYKYPQYTSCKKFRQCRNK